MEKASNLNLAAIPTFASFTLGSSTTGEAGFVLISKSNLLKVKGGCNPGYSVGDKRRRRTGG